MPARAARTAAFLLLAAGQAGAQDLQNLHPAVGTRGFFVVESARTTPNGLITPSVWLHTSYRPVVRRDTEAHISEAVVAHQTTLDVQGALGLGSRFEVTLGLPVSYVTGTGLEATGDDGVGIGDARLGGKVRLAGFEDEQIVGLAFSLPITVPIGSEDKFLGSAGFTFTPTVIGEVAGDSASLALQVGTRLRTETDRIENIELNHELVWGTAGRVELGVDWLALVGEVNGSVALGEVLDEDVTRPVESLFGLRYESEEGNLLTLGGGLGINPDRGVPAFRVLVAFAWRPPRQRGPQIDPEALLSDADHDGVLELDDRCPSEPEDEDGFQDDDGCPDVDNDQDGIRDSLDRCPDQPETVNGYQDSDGCPDKGDADRDGLPDERDRCPDEPEDKDGFKDDDGCPDPDNDGDGLLDTLDRCPGEAETVNGFQDADGCPDEVPAEEPVKKPRGRRGR